MTAFYIKSFLFILGSCLGSFCNVLIHRSTSENPKDQSILGRSRCPHCGYFINPKDLIPLISFLILRGRCRSCGHTLTGRYWIVELILGLVSMQLYPLVLFGDVIGFVLWMTLSMGLVTLFFTDYEKGLLPDMIQIPLFLFFWIGTAWIDPYPFSRMSTGLISAVLGWCLIWFLSRLYFIFRHQEGFGGGDGKMLAWIGVFYEWRSMLGIFFLATILGTLWGILLKIQRKGPWNMELPFGSLLAVSAAIMALWGDRLGRFYLESVIS